jgi:hypothetical protein
MLRVTLPPRSPLQKTLPSRDVLLFLEDIECICELCVCDQRILNTRRILECALGAKNYNILFLLLEFNSCHE